jgi:GT2 family glycosyltransferase
VSSAAADSQSCAPRVTVVVASRNRREELLRNLRRHDVPVILVDNGSTDGTVDAVRAELPHVRVVPLRRNHGAPARNVGAGLAGTPYVAFADDDSWWEPGAFSLAADLLDRYPLVGLLAGHILVGEEGRSDPVCAQMARSPLTARDELPGVPVLGFVACGSVVRRRAFLEAGGFDPVVFFAGEEERVSIDLASAGWEQCYVPELVVRHLPSPSRSGAGARQRLITRNRVLTAVMRRPWRTVLRVSGQELRSGWWPLCGVLTALPRLPGAVRRRCPAGPQVEARLRLLERTA